MLKFLGASAALLIALTGMAHASQQHADWSSDRRDDGRCIAFATPQTSDGSIDGRTAPFITVMNSPKEGIRGAISIVSGSEKTGLADVKVSVDGKEHEVLPFKSAAFAASGQPEAALLNEMRRGHFVSVTWNTEEGQTVTDTYSLTGFTAAHNAIENCR